MGAPGIPLNLTRKDIEDALKRNKGIVKNCAQDFNCKRETFLNYMYEYPDLCLLRKELANGYDQFVLDMAEDNIIKLLEDCDSTATYYTLNMRGEKRGWNKEKKEDRSAELNALLSAQQEKIAAQEEAKALRNALRAAGVPLPEGLDKSESNAPAQS